MLLVGLRLSHIGPKGLVGREHGAVPVSLGALHGEGVAQVGPPGVKPFKVELFKG